MNKTKGKAVVVVRSSSPERLAYRPKEIPALTGIGQGRIYELIAQGALPSVTIGRRILVPAEALKRLLSTEVKI